MKHAHTRIWIHVIWGTKDHTRCLFKKVARELHIHFIEKANELIIPFEEIRIQPEHIHGLINLPADKCLSEFIQKIKGESAHWINQGHLMGAKFEWQRGYGAFSVSATQYKIVKNYIKNQEAHHKRKSFQEEYDEWRKEYGIFDD